MHASVQAFRDWLVNYRGQHLLGPDPSLDDLYRIYCNLAGTNNTDRPVVAGGQALNQALHTIHDNVVRVRNFRTQTTGIDNAFWRNFSLILAVLHGQSQQAEAAAYCAYLNRFFAADYTYLFPNAGRGNANARFILDVLPAGMSTVLGPLATVMDNRASATVMKFLGPGANGKLDTAIVYCNSGDGSFGNLRQDLLTLQGQQAARLHDRLPLMVQRLAAGLGYAEEPPAILYGPLLARRTEPLSFGEYRVIVLLMAYRGAASDIADGRYDEGEFDEALDQNIGELFDFFGLDPDAPQTQGQVTAPDPLKTAFIQIYAQWRRGNANFYGNGATLP